MDWDPTFGPFYFHSYILRFLTERSPQTLQFTRIWAWSKTLRFISFGAPLAQKPFNLLGLGASWDLLAPSGPFLEPPGAFLGCPGGSWGLVGPSGASWALLGLPKASGSFLGLSLGLLGPPGASCQAWRKRNEAEVDRICGCTAR